MQSVFHDISSAGLLDFVSAWYRKAADYMAENPKIKAAFVSTNSITQGEQVGILWPDLLKRGVKVHFAHQTFQWSSEARDKAAVHCVIIGFALHDAEDKRVFNYDSPQAEPHEVRANHINPYLVDAPSNFLERRERPICNVPLMRSGNKPIDDGNYLFTPEEREDFLKCEPAAAPYFHRWLGGEEFINGIERWYLWLGQSDQQKQAIENAAQAVLDARAKFPNASLADLYDPLTMPVDLTKAHQKLDAAVDRAYANRKFTGDSDRVAFLFELYREITSPLEPKKATRRKRTKI